ncbi:flotillin family protein [soil metagenome]
MEFALIGGVVVLVLILVALMAVSRLIVIAEPNEAVVLTGRKAGYRIVRGGRTFRMPLIERVSRIPLRTLPIEVKVENAFSRGGIPLEVQGIANVKIASDPPQVFNNAVERLLDLELSEIYQIAKDTLEGNLRGVLATLSPEEVNEDRLKFANELIEEADSDLKRLGLQLDMLKIQNVTDRVNYLDSIGRAKNAEILRIAAVAEAERQAETKVEEALARQRAEVANAEAAVAIAEAQNVLKIRQIALEQEAIAAEAQRQAETKEKEAEARRRAEVANAEARMAVAEAEAESRRRADVANAEASVNIAEAENLLRVRRAELDQQAASKEKVAVAEAERARVVAEQAVEEARVELQQRRLRADVVEPAEAERRASELRAEGDAARIRERGLAQVGVFQALLEQMEQGGDDALRVYLAEKLPDLFQRAADSLDEITIDRLVVLDREGEGVSRVANQKPAAILGMIEQMAGGLGLDLDEVLQRRGAKARAEPTPRADPAGAEAGNRALPRGDGAGAES